MAWVCSSPDRKNTRSKLLVEDAEHIGGRPDALLLSRGETKVPAPMAARVLGTAGHAHDWDDSQVSVDPAHVYGLLTHPTIPPLSSALVMAQKLGGIDGKTFMLAFLTGFEVECKISEWMLPQHYMRGLHSSGTVGTFGAFAAAAKLLRIERRTTAQRLRHRRQLRRRHPLQLRHHDQAAPCRPRRGEWRDRGAARGARLHRRSRCPRRPLGFFRRPGRRRQRGENLRRVSARPGRSSSPAYRSNPILAACSPTRPSI